MKRVILLSFMLMAFLICFPVGSHAQLKAGDPVIIGVPTFLGSIEGGESGDWVEQVMLTSIATLLIVAAVQAMDPVRIADVWDVSWGARLTMLATFAATLVIPVTYSVLLGMAWSVLLYLYRASTDLRVVEVVPQPNGLLKEQEAPRALADNAMTILDAHGSIFFASIDALESRLPQPETARNAVVILRLRNRSSVESSFVRMLKHYALRLKKSGSVLMLSGATPEVIEQLRRTEVTDVIPEQHIFPATEIIGEALQNARAAGQRWIAQHRPEQ